MADEDEAEAEKKFETMFNKFFHKAIGDRDKRFEGKIKKMFDEGVGSKFDELRAALVETDDDDDADVMTDIQPGGVGAQPGMRMTAEITPEVRAQLRRAEQTAKEAKDQAERYAKQYEEEKTARRRTEERQMLVSLMQPHVKSKLLDMVVDRVHEKHFYRDPDTDQPLWKDENGETLPLKDGAAAWTKSEVGKEFAPPVEVRGRGGRGGDGNGAIQPGKMTVEQLGDIVAGSIPGQGRH